jgi:hypothetical protein
MFLLATLLRSPSSENQDLWDDFFWEERFKKLQAVVLSSPDLVFVGCTVTHRASHTMLTLVLHIRQVTVSNLSGCKTWGLWGPDNQFRMVHIL